MSTTDPSPPPGPLNPKHQLRDDDRFRFTPVKAARAAPRVWDRKPSTSYLARPRSRTVWKRFRTSFNSMKALQQMIAADDHEDDNLNLEINSARGLGFLRGVKRRCLVAADSDEKSRGRSFLETKWELERAGKRRKTPRDYYNAGLVDTPEPMAADGQQPDANDEMSDEAEDVRDTSTSSAEVAQSPEEGDESLTSSLDASPALVPGPAYPRTLHGQSILQTEVVEDASDDLKEHEGSDSPLPRSALLSRDGEDDAGDQTHAAVTTSTTQQDSDAAHAMTDDRAQLDAVADNTDAVAAAAPETAPATAPVQDLTAEQESTLVRSALRSSLDMEDAALLNNFLSKAKAKREAKAATMIAQDTEEEEKPATPEKKMEVMETVEIPTPQSQTRRVLEDLDTNSPSPQKPQLSPTKALLNREKDIGQRDEDQQSPAPSSPRRSTRSTRNTKPPSSSRTTAAAATSVQNTFSLRRAKGTEFVFLKRTEAQELALATRRNTRQNKGDSLLPKYTLQTLTRSPPSSPSKFKKTPVDDGSKSARSSGRSPSSPKKQVSWNDARLEQYEGESGGEGEEKGKQHSDDVGSRRTKTTASKSSEKRKASSRSRSTRSQGSPKAAGGSDGDSDPAASTTAPATASTPRTRRVRRLGTSKSAAAAFDTGASSSSSSSSPTTSPTDKRKRLTPRSPRTGLLGVSASVSKGGSSSSSIGSSGKSANILKAHAGSTPVPRRVRSRD